MSHGEAVAIANDNAPVSAHSLDDGGEAALHVLDQLTHQYDSDEDQDNERKKHQYRPLAAAGDGDGWRLRPRARRPGAR